MNKQEFLDNFGHFLDAPDGIDRLRELILQLAVTGKLTAQWRNDNPELISGENSAENLLKKIKAEKQRLIDEKVLKREKTLPQVNFSELPFSLPDGWKWQRLNDLCSYIQRGKSPKYSERSNVPVISQKCVQWSGFELDKARFISLESLEKYSSERFLQDGDLLWNSTGHGTLGRIIVFKKQFKKSYSKVVADSHVTVIRPMKINSNYLFYWLAGPTVQSKIYSASSGSTKQIELATRTIKSYTVPIAPLSEQKAIVDKVDELMAVCDKLEKKQQLRAEKVAKFNQACLDELVNAETSDEFAAKWQQITQNFDIILPKTGYIPKATNKKVKEHVGLRNLQKLRETILQLAVTGKLTQKWREDNPKLISGENSADELFTQISKNKANKKKASPKNNTSFPLAGIWKWVNLEDIIENIDSGWSPNCTKYPTNNEEEWGVLKTTAVQELKYIAKEHKALPSSLSPKPEKEVRNGDLLITRAGPKNRVGICCLVKKTRKKLMISDKIIRLKLISKEMEDFLALCINTGITRDYLQRQMSGMAESQMNISQAKLKKAPVPVIPLPESKQLSKRLGHLFHFCDKLEEKLTKSQNVAQKQSTTLTQTFLGLKQKEPLPEFALRKEFVKYEIPSPSSLEKSTGLSFVGKLMKENLKQEISVEIKLRKTMTTRPESKLAAILFDNGRKMEAKALWKASGFEKIDDFYAQLKKEIEVGTIALPKPGELKYVAEKK